MNVCAISQLWHISPSLTYSPASQVSRVGFGFGFGSGCRFGPGLGLGHTAICAVSDAEFSISAGFTVIFRVVTIRGFFATRHLSNLCTKRAKSTFLGLCHVYVFALQNIYLCSCACVYVFVRVCVWAYAFKCACWRISTGMCFVIHCHTHTYPKKITLTKPHRK